MKPLSRAMPDFEGMPVRWVQTSRRTLTLILHPEGWLEIRSPLRTSEKRVMAFMQSKAAWIRGRSGRLAETVPLDRSRPDPLETQDFQARTDKIVGFYLPLLPAGATRLVRLSFRSQRSRWGSCSARGSISINFACSRLPERLLEYIVIHELCHLVRMDHSAAFHTLLGSLLPDAAQRKAELSRYRIRSVPDPAPDVVLSSKSCF